MGTSSFVNQRIVSAVKREDFVSDRVSYTVVRGRWCNVVVWNVHAPSDNRSDDSKDSLYAELVQVSDHSSKHNMKILLGDFNAKWGHRILSNRQLGMAAYIRIVMIMGVQ